MKLARILAAAAVAGLGVLAKDILLAAGGTPKGARRDRVRRSPQFSGGAFRNRASTSALPPPGGARETLREFFGGQRRTPAAPVPLAPPDPGPGITWYGHASTLVEIDGARVLLDPMWSERASPSRHVGPRRLHPNPVEVSDLPRLDAILISHDHYDHLDLPTVLELVRTQEAPFVVPLGVGAHLERWKVPAHRIVELDWEEHHQVAGLTLTATAAQHFSGRLFARDGTLWASWVIAGETRKVFYTGDSGYFDGYAEVGQRHGPFDATLVQVGAYAPGWPDIHMTPEQGVAAHVDLRGDLLIPVHWATFKLAPHGWGEPADRVWAEAKARGVRLAIPRPGQRVDLASPPPVDPWWQVLA